MFNHGTGIIKHELDIFGQSTDLFIRRTENFYICYIKVQLMVFESGFERLIEDLFYDKDFNIHIASKRNFSKKRDLFLD